MQSTGATLWTDAFLDEMRECGDPIADQAFRDIFDPLDLPRAQAFMASLVDNDELPEDVPADLRAYLDQTKPPSTVYDTRTVELGAEVFCDHGPEILLVLACYALPASYAAGKGVQVLHRTGFLKQRANRRLLETVQLVVDTMSPGGLGANGMGIRTAQKVRLMHAAIRYLILHDGTDSWNPEWGVPINQEDLAGTLMTFTTLVMDGLRKLRIEVTPEREQAYLDRWRVVGQIVGVRPELIPATPEEARILCDTIQRRQIAPTPEGREMTHALLEMLRENMPGEALDGICAALLRHFLPEEVADGLAVPRSRAATAAVGAVVAMTDALDAFFREGDQRSGFYREIGLRFIDLFLQHQRQGQRVAFRLPAQVDEAWRRAAASESA